MKKKLRRTVLVVLISAAALLGVYFYRIDNGCHDAVRRSKEAVLHENLFILRALIQQYSQDKKKAPQSLHDLVQAGYLKRIPSDPMTGKPDWIADEVEVLDSVDQQEAGIGDVHSASSEQACDGRTYNTW